jgi:hypothetical protein
MQLFRTSSVSTTGVSFPGVNFPGMSFQGVSFLGASFPGVSFPGVSFPGVSFLGASFQGVSFPGMRLWVTVWKIPAFTRNESFVTVCELYVYTTYICIYYYMLLYEPNLIYLLLNFHFISA